MTGNRYLFPIAGGEKKEEFEETFGLYFHIPFCKKKCPYCHFYVIKDNEAQKEALLNAFLEEIDLLTPLFPKKLVTIYFGGGTPSLFPIPYLKKVLEKIPFSLENVEITLEANPDYTSLENFKELLEIGINRISLGIQSLETELLTQLGRTHTETKGAKSVWDAYHAGFRNISIDLMYDIPKLTLPLWKSTLEKAVQLPITHLSLYNLTLEPNTVFGRQEKEIQKMLASEEESLAMYQMAQKILGSHELLPYEISAFAKEGFHSQHNTGYWLGRPFLGIGPSAFSFYNKERFQNICQFQPYVEKIANKERPIVFTEKLSEKASQRELFAIHIRLLEGVFLPDFEEKFGSLDTETLKILDNLMSQGFIDLAEKRYALTQKGILFYDTVAEELVLI